MKKEWYIRKIDKEKENRQSFRNQKQFIQAAVCSGIIMGIQSVAAEDLDITIDEYKEIIERG